jgi:hypothetical protein
MKRDPFIELILQNAQSLNMLKDDIDRTYKKRDESHEALKSWENACDFFHASWDNLAFPGGLSKEMELLKKHDSTAIDQAILYLKANPYYFRSGYIKQKILTRLKQAQLTNKQILQLQDILIDVIQRTGRRENREYHRLAAKIADPKFRARIQDIMQKSKDPQIIERAQRMLDKL